jgi:RNA polymerase II C-terminal domain phosphatase-like 1/2
VNNYPYPPFLPAATLHVIQVPEHSCFINIRPGWDDLKSYLTTTTGRRRYKVYVCTMAGRDYALEAWRLLDPEGSLIGSEEISQRLICVKPGKIKREFHFFFLLS